MFLSDNRTWNGANSRPRPWSSLTQLGSSIMILLFLVGNAMGFISIASIQQPGWWLAIGLWVPLITFPAFIQVSPLHHTRFFWRRKKAAHNSSPYPSALRSNPDLLEAHTADQFITIIPQIVDAFEISFQHMGVRTEEHRHEIEKAVSTLYRQPDFDKQVLADCLQRLLQAAQRNWTELAEFSPREREVLELLLQNISYREMGSRLHVSISTIKTHVYHIFQKLNISTREDAIHLIRERGWFY